MGEIFRNCTPMKALRAVSPWCCNRFIRRLLFTVTGLMMALPTTSHGAEPSKQTKASSENRARSEKEPIHLVLKSRADLKQIFTYYPYPAMPAEVQGYDGSKLTGAGMYRLTVDAQGAVSQVQILKPFMVSAAYDGRYSNLQQPKLPAPNLDKVVRQALIRWRAKPGPMRIVDIQLSIGPAPGMY